MVKILLAAALLSSSSFGAVYILGTGSITCAKVTKFKDDPGANEILKGYIYGVAIGRSHQEDINPPKDYMFGYSAEDLLAWTHNYCEKNPLDYYYGAINALYKELEK